MAAGLSLTPQSPARLSLTLIHLKNLKPTNSKFKTKHINWSQRAPENPSTTSTTTGATLDAVAAVDRRLSLPLWFDLSLGSLKLVKIQRLRSDLEEKLMKKMAVVHRKAEEWRAASRLQHSEQTPRVAEQAQKIVNRVNSHSSGHHSCGCFPCNSHHL